MRNFNGTTDNIRADAARVFSPTAACSFSMLVKAAPVASACVYGEANTGSINNIFEIASDATGAKVAIVARNSAGTTTTVTTTTASAFDSTFHRICYTQDASKNWVVYIDGVLDKSGTHTLSSISPNDLAFGALIRSSNAGFFAGAIGEVANWTRALSAKEALSLANGVPASLFAPAHYWPLWGSDSPEPDIGVGTHVGGTLTGTTFAAGRHALDPLTLVGTTAAR